MRDIDEMDMLYYLRVRGHEMRKRKNKETEKKRAYIDQVWPGL